MKPRELWIDFNEVEDDSRVCTLLEYASDPSGVIVGARLVVGDDEGNRCEAVVVSLDLTSGLVELAVDGNTFNRGRVHHDSLLNA